jgi:hypothetical protein
MVAMRDGELIGAPRGRMTRPVAPAPAQTNGRVVAVAR